MKPIFAYSHGRGGCSVTGGYVVADRRLRSLYRRYVYADFCEGSCAAWSRICGGAGDDRKLGLSVDEPGLLRRRRPRPRLRHLAGGPVYRLVP